MHYKSQNEIKNSVNHTLEEVIQQQKHKASTIHPDYAELWEAMEGLIMAGGKRLRPYLTYLAFTMYNGVEAGDIFRVAAAQEFLHFALLIHDDIIDRDTIRYGRKNVMGTYESVYSEAGSDSSHFASGAALMAGDLALSQAYELISQSKFPPQKIAEAIACLSQSIFHVAGGELLDMEATFRQSGADYFCIAQHKTASYSFIGPLQTGASLASAPAADLQQLRQYGLNLGIAYQLSDDLLGLYGDERSIGKPVISDLREGKKTYLFALIQQLSGEVDRKYFAEVWGNPRVTMQDVSRVRQMGVESSAKDKVEELMKEYAQQSLDALTQLGLPGDSLDPLRLLAHQSVNRTY